MMTLQKTRKQIQYATIDGIGYVLFGTRPDNGKWLERWFESAEKAIAFADRKGWGVVRNDTDNE
jgi:hypothetical protein